VKLLFDQNLSPGLVQHLSDLYPGSEHVFLAGLDRASDALLWDYARQNGFTIVTKDADFTDMSEVLGFPPKVIWIRLGNCSTNQIECILRQHHDAIVGLAENANAHILTLV
jgi:predicted nuclease of predicted toxin-antitoxin system